MHMVQALLQHLSGIHNPVQINRRGRDRRLAQHHMQLSAVMGLVIEKMGHGNLRGFDHGPTLRVRVMK